MKIITLPVSDLHPADYNPRKDLAPGDKQYDKLARSIETFGYVEPIVWNRTTGNIVGGHQRLKVLVEQGYKTVEKQIRASYECLKLLAETKYPFVVSTKGRLIADPEYLDLLAQCNCVLQISMVCSKYDRLERGTPSYEERLSILKTVSDRVQRTIVRIQPYMPEVFHDVMKNIPRIAEAGAYGVIVEGMKFFKAKPGMTKIGGDFCYPLPRLRHDFEAIKAECHRYGLKFYSGENRLRAMGDSMTCCGIDGLPGFRPNEYNLCMLMNGKNPEPTEKMKEVGTGGPFKTLNQSAGSGRKIAKQSFYGLMQEELAKKTDYHRKVFGLDE